jgi:hypothetical protein
VDDVDEMVAWNEEDALDHLVMDVEKMTRNDIGVEVVSNFVPKMAREPWIGLVVATLDLVVHLEQMVKRMILGEAMPLILVPALNETVINLSTWMVVH